MAGEKGVELGWERTTSYWAPDLDFTEFAYPNLLEDEK